MTIRIVFNGVPLDCEYHPENMNARTAVTAHGDDVLPALSASFAVLAEVDRLVREAHRKEYGE